MGLKKILLSIFLCSIVSFIYAQQHRYASDLWRVLDDEKCDGSVEIEMIRYRGNHKWGYEKTIYLQFKNSSGNWEDLASIEHDYTDHNTYRARRIGSYHITFQNRNPSMGYEYYAYKLIIHNAPNPNQAVAYRWIQKQNNDYLSDTKYITGYKPMAPTLTVQNSTGCGVVKLSWNRPSNVDSRTRFYLYRRKKGWYYWSEIRNTTGTSYDDHSAGNEKMEYRVVAKASCGQWGYYSDVVEGHGILPISAPTRFEVEAQCEVKAKLTWNVSQPVAESYEIEVANNSSFSNSTKYTTSSGHTTEKVVELAEPFVPYFFRIRSVNECDVKGSWSEIKQEMAYDLPDVPENFLSTLNKADNTFSFTWDDVTNEEGYIIRRVNKSDASDVVDFEIAENETSFTDETVNFCVPYRYTLLSQRECGEVRGESIELTLTPDLSNYFQGFDISKGYYSDRVELKWNVATTRSLSEVQIYRSEKGEVRRELVATLESRQKAWTDYKAEANKLYDYELIGLQYCGEETVETNTLIETGFRMPFGTVYGNVSFKGGNPVEKVEIIAEPVDDSALVGFAAELDGSSYIEVPHSDVFESVDQITVQMLLKVDEAKDDIDRILFEKYKAESSEGFKITYNSQQQQVKAIIGTGSGVQTHAFNIAIPSDSYAFFALVVSDTNVKLYLNENEVASADFSSTIMLPSVAMTIGGKTSEDGFKGLIDEFAFYKRAKTAEDITNDYNRKLSANEDALLVYYQVDEGVGEYVYDSSKTGSKYNKQHGKFVDVEWTQVIPSASQLAYKTSTDKDGNYTLSFVKYAGRGQVFNITPIKGIHQFLPSQKRQFLGEGTEYVSVDFKDVSSFRVTGTVRYTLDGSNYPAKGIRLLIDGQIVTDHGRVVETNANGEFDIQVPIGEHIISVQKEEHEFEHSTFPANGELYDFRENITGIEFFDNTSILVAGRVVGGRVEGDKLIGFGLSENNIGQATISFQSEQDDRYQKQVTTDLETGEYEVKLLPINMLVTNLTVANPDVVFAPESYSDILELEKELIEKEEKKHEYEDRDKTVISSTEVYKYNFKKNFIYRAKPSLALYNVDDSEFRGESMMPVVVNRQTEETVELDVSNNALGYPVLFSDKQYAIKIKAFEEYTNPNRTPVVTSRVPVVDGKISIFNNLGAAENLERNGDAETLDLDSDDGVVGYTFVSKKPTLLVNEHMPAFNFTETLKVTLEAGGNIAEWKPEGEFFRAFLVGSKTKGKDFVTTGPETVKWILHDPPGSNSSTFIESGTTLTTAKEVSFHQTLSNNLNTVLSVGPAIVIGGGLLGPQITTETKTEFSVNFNVEQSAGRNDIDVTEVTFNNTVATSSDPNQVGAISDLFVGYASNIVYGEAEALGLMPVQKITDGGFEAVGSEVTIQGVPYRLAKSPSFYINTKGFSTMFIYSHHHIANILIPNIEKLRNNLFAKEGSFYSSHLDASHDNYGINNDDPRWQSNVSTSDPLATAVEDYDGESYRYDYRRNPEGIDSVRWYNQQIRLWEEALARSEKEKVESTKFFDENSSNVSFVGGGQVFAGSKTTTHTTTTEEVWDITLDNGFAATFGAKINKAGTLNTNVFSLKLGGGEKYTSSEAESNTFGYTLADDDVGDAFTVDILDTESGSSPVFRLRAGRSSCPFEKPEATKYYQPGTIFNQGTQQREKAELRVLSSQVVDNVPGHEAAVFTLSMGNASETGDASWYGLRVVEGSNPHGAAVKLNGGILSTPVEIRGGSASQVQVTVHKNPKYDDYEDLKVMMYSTCEFQNYQNYGNVPYADTIKLSAFFIPSCGDLHIVQPTDNWVINTRSENRQEIVIEGLNSIDEEFKELYIQYRPEGAASWINLQKYVADAADVEDGVLLLEAGVSTLKYDWNTEQVNEGNYELRLLSKCKSDIVNESIPIVGIIDREAPQIFGAVSPEDGVLNAGDVIRFPFTEDLRTELISKQNVVARGVLNGSEINHSVAAYFDGVDNNMLIRTNGQTFNRSFTIEFWARRDGDGEQVIFAQSSNTNRQFEIAFDANNQLVLTAGNEQLAVPGEVEQGKWFHWAFSYDLDSRLMTIFKNDADVARKIWPEDIVRIGDVRLGMASQNQAKPFSGALHELRIWNKALTRSDVASKMSSRISGTQLSLYGLWRIDEGLGDVCKDEVRSNNAVFNADWEISPKGRSVAFDGTAGMKVKADKFAFANNDDFTLSFWFYTAAPNEQTLFALGTGVLTDQPTQWSISLDATGHLIAHNKGQDFSIGNGTYNDGEWHHFSMVVRNPGATNFLIDGNVESSVGSADVGGLAGSYFWLGALGEIDEFGQTNTSNYMTGNIDELRIWSYARTQQMIQRDMNFKLSGQELGLEAYIPLEQYVVEQNIAQLKPRFADLSSNNAIIDHTGLQLSENVPTIKLPRAVENVNFNLVKNERSLVIALDEDLSRIEKALIDITVLDVLDKQNNKMATPHTHTVRVDQGQLRWNRSSFKTQFAEHAGGEFKLEIVNTGVQTQSYTISNLPTWLEVRPQSGLIEGGKTQELTFTVHAGLNVGYYNEQLYVRGNDNFNEPLFLDIAIQATRPDWENQVGNHQYNMNVIGRLVIDDIPSTDENDMIAAYVGNDLRGYAKVKYQQAYDNYAVYLSVGSDLSSGEVVTFKIWDASTGLVYPIDDITYTFQTEALKGSVSNPVVFRSGNMIQRDVPLKAGWNWISVNLRKSDDQINTVFGQFGAEEGDRLVGSSAFYEYNNDRWTGSDQLIAFTSMYKLKVEEEKVLRLSGIPVDPITTKIALSEGWNWIAYTPQFNAEINEALSLYNAQENDEIKTMNKFARYDSQTRKWYGSLTHLSPGEGYQLKTSANSELFYPDRSTFTNQKTATLQLETEETRSTLFVDSRVNMSIVAELQNSIGIGIDAKSVTAFSGSSPLSISKAVNVTGHHGDLFFITIPKTEQDEPITFKYEDNYGNHYEVITTLGFEADASIGTIAKPKALLTDNTATESTFAIYPNPVLNEMYIRLNVRKESKVVVEIVDITGRVVERKDIGHRTVGIHLIDFSDSAQKLRHGVYTISATFNGTKITRRLIKK